MIERPFWKGIQVHNTVQKVVLRNFKFWKKYGHLKQNEKIMIFLNFLFFLLLAIFSKISVLQGSGCAFETVLVASFHLRPISTKSDKKIFFFSKSKPIPLKYLQYSKFKKFCQIKNVNMQIDRNGTQKCCTLNRLKIFQKLRLPWLFKVHRIIQNNWKLELALITLKSTNVVVKLISCPF